MGFFDYVSDLYSSLSIQDAYADDRQAEARQFEGPVDTSGEQSDGKDVARGGMGTAHQRGGAGVQGGVSTKTPASGTDEESESEKEANEGTASSAKGRSSGEADKGHSPGEGGAASGQRAGAHEAGPYGGPVKAAAKDEDEEEEEEEEEDEEEDDEPVDPKQQLEEGKCLVPVVELRRRLLRRSMEMARSISA